jgi:hypothetical protein
VKPGCGRCHRNARSTVRSRLGANVTGQDRQAKQIPRRLREEVFGAAYRVMQLRNPFRIHQLGWRAEAGGIGHT